MTNPCDYTSVLRLTSIRGYSIALLPVGSIEWHCGGPIGLDSLLSLFVARSLCEVINEECGNAVLLPPFYYGASSEWSGFEEISIPRNAIPVIMEGVVRSLERMGYTVLVIVNSHGGNSAALRYAIERLVFDRGVRLRLYILEWWRLLGVDIGHMDAAEAGLAREALGVEVSRLCECSGLSNPYTHVECRMVEGEPRSGVREELLSRLKGFAEKICEDVAARRVPRPSGSGT